MSNLRFAFLSLMRSPGFTLVAVATLALGIGANTSMFSLLNGYLLQPPPYPDSDRIDRLYRVTPQSTRGGFAPADYVELQASPSPYGDVAAYASTDISLSEAGRPAEMAVGLRVSANFFRVLGAQAERGRLFGPHEDVFGNHHVIVISHRYWQERFGGDPATVGHAVRLNGETYEIVGVLPATFSDWRHLSWNDVYRPLALDAQESRDRSTPWLRLVGKRGAQVSRAQADTFVADFGRRLAAAYPAAHAGTAWRAVPIADTFLPRDGRMMMTMLLGLSGFVLLIACSNLANLLLARTLGRAREFAVRSALGASRTQALRPLFLESLLLALAGGAGAIVVARWTFDYFAVVSAGDNGVGVALALDWRVLGWAFAACLFTALAFGVAPALFVQGLDLNTTLKNGARGTTGDRSHRRFRSALIVGQFALAMVLLAGAALFAQGLHEINNRRHGWESDHLVTGTLVMPSTTYASDAQVAAFQGRAIERLEALPGVVSASVSYTMPFFGLAESRKFVAAGLETPQAGHEPQAAVNGVGPRYFETVGTRLLAGRTFSAADDHAATRVYVINESMARGLFGDSSPLGRRLAPAGSSPAWGEIVGVVADVESVFPDRAAVRYQLYQPVAQEPRRVSDIAVRTSGVAPTAVVEDIRRTMASLDADVLVRKLQTADQAIERANYQDGVLASVLTALAALGLGLAALGVYGVIARTVAQRTGEFGIRLALGATARDITRLVLGSGTRLALVGCALGLLGAFGVARIFAAAFPGLQISPGPVLPAATALLLAIAQLAAWLPARRAARISPTEALRSE